MEHFISIMKRLILEGDRDAGKEFNHDGIHISVCAIASDDSQRSLRESAVIFAVYELYLVLNFSDPGILNLHGSEIKPDPPEMGYRGQDYRREISLGGHPFEAALYEQEESPWLTIKRIPPLIVANWVRGISRPDNLVPDNPSAKALYALLRISKGDMDAAALIWVFYALEALFQCRPGENFSAYTGEYQVFLP
jgi:hypothetical protein